MCFLTQLVYLLSVLAVTSTAAPEGNNSQVDVSTLPSCAIPGAITALQASGCQLSDIPCICRSQDFVHDVKTYAEGHCNESELQAILSFGETACASAGTPLASDDETTTSEEHSSASSSTRTPTTYSPTDTDVSFVTMNHVATSTGTGTGGTTSNVSFSGRFGNSTDDGTAITSRTALRPTITQSSMALTSTLHQADATPSTAVGAAVPRWHQPEGGQFGVAAAIGLTGLIFVAAFL